MKGHLVMSAKERRRKSVFDEVLTGRLTIRCASIRLDLSYRQCRRSYARFLTQGDAGLVHRCRGESVVAAVGTLTTLSWIFRRDIDLGFVTIPGWSGLFPSPGHIHDSTVAIFFASLLFVIPVDWKKGEFALDWDWAKRIPWGILILFGGGLALAKAFVETGLVFWLGNKLVLLDSLPDFAIILCVAVALTFITELVYFVEIPVFGIEPGVVPDWANIAR